MDVLNAILILAPLVVLIVGMISPQLVLWWHRIPERLFVVVLFLGLFLFDLGIGMWLTPVRGLDESTSTVCFIVGTLFLSFNVVQAQVWDRR